MWDGGARCGLWLVLLSCAARRGEGVDQLRHRSQRAAAGQAAGLGAERRRLQRKQQELSHLQDVLSQQMLAGQVAAADAAAAKADAADAAERVGEAAAAAADGCQWSYELCGPHNEGSCAGPSAWSTLCDGAYAACAGSEQSPIDIDISTLAQLEYSPRSPPLLTAYRPVDATLRNTGLGLEIPANFGWVEVEGVKYVGRAVHFHSPSAHTKKGERFPLEMQILHQAEAGAAADAPQKLAVSVFFDEAGVESALLRNVLQKGAPAAGLKVALSGVDLNLATGLHDQYIQYDGSLPYPPCTESVRNLLMIESQRATKDQLDMFLKLLTPVGPMGNNRPPQPLAGRTVSLVNVNDFYIMKWLKDGESLAAARKQKLDVHSAMKPEEVATPQIIHIHGKQ